MFDPKRRIWIDKDLTVKYYGGRYPVVDTTFLKKRKLNPVGEHVFLNRDGSIKRDEDKIIAVQRLWLHHAYKPGGCMYTLKKSTNNWNKDGDCAADTDC